jgi:hypothetical protein
MEIFLLKMGSENNKNIEDPLTIVSISFTLENHEMLAQ